MNGDLLGRTVSTVREIPALMCVDDRIDQKPLTVEAMIYHGVASPRRHDVLIHIKNLEARAAAHETAYGRNFLQGTANRLRADLNTTLSGQAGD